MAHYSFIQMINRIVTVQECDATMMKREQMLVTKNKKLIMNV
jgi:hypothetical protein